MKIILIVPDGVAVRNFLYSNFLDELQKKGFEILGLLLAIGIQGVLGSSEKTCEDPIPYETSQWSNQTTIIDYNIIDEKESITSWESQKYLYISLIINCFFLLGYIMLVVFVKENLG